MSGQIEIQLREQDLQEAMRLHYGRRRGKSFFIMVAFGVVIALVIIAIARVDDIAKMMTILGTMLVWCIVILALVLVLNRFILIPRLSRKAYAQQADLRRPMVYRWDDERFALTQTNGHWTRPWCEFVSWRRGEKVFLFYQSDYLFHLLPINVDTIDAITAIHHHLVAHAVPEK